MLSLMIMMMKLLYLQTQIKEIIDLYMAKSFYLQSEDSTINQLSLIS